MVCSKRGQNFHIARPRGSSRRRRGRLYANRRCRPHAQLTRACGRSISATVRPRPRAGSEPSSCGTPSIPRPRWCAGRCAARRRPERLQSFGTIMLVLAMPLQLALSTKQVLLTPLAHLALPPRSPPTGCSLCMAGDHWTLRWKLFLMAAKQQHLAAAWRRAGARAACHAHASVCAEAWRGPRPRSGRRLVVELTDPRYLAGPPGPTAELGGLWSPWVSYTVDIYAKNMLF